MDLQAQALKHTSDTPDGRNNLATSLSLLGRLRLQDRDAWQVFLTLYAPLVVRWCARRGLDEVDIEDVSQEVFGKAARGIGQFRKETPEDSLRGWLCRITHREMANLFRQRRQAVAPEGGTGALRRLEEHTEDGLPEPLPDEVRQETSYLFQRAMELARGEFTDRTWQMFWRTAIDDNSATAVAEELGTTSAAVRQAKSRVLYRLRQLVGDVAE